MEDPYGPRIIPDAADDILGTSPRILKYGAPSTPRQLPEEFDWRRRVSNEPWILCALDVEVQRDPVGNIKTVPTM